MTKQFEVDDVLAQCVRIAVIAELAVRGMKQSELADAAGISTSAMSTYIKGTRDMRLREVSAICRVFGWVNPGEFVARAYASHFERIVGEMLPDRE